MSLFVFACDDTPSKEDVLRAFNTYVDTVPALNDTLMYYDIQGDSLIIHFAAVPEIKDWIFNFQHGEFKPYDLRSKNEIVIVDEYIRTMKKDSPAFCLSAMPVIHDKLFMNKKQNPFAPYGFMSISKGVLAAKRPENFLLVDHSFYRKIEDEKLKHALIDMINEHFDVHDGTKVLPYIDSAAKKR